MYIYQKELQLNCQQDINDVTFSPEAQIRFQTVRIGVLLGRIGPEYVFLQLVRFLLSVIIQRMLHINSYIIRGMGSGPIRGRSPHRHSLTLTQHNKKPRCMSCNATRKCKGVEQQRAIEVTKEIRSSKAKSLENLLSKLQFPSLKILAK